MSRIPKTIHYIWLGGGELDELSQKCMRSWLEILPDYRLVCWDEENSAEIIMANNYAREAYAAKKYAFVSDYLRLHILFYNGGIYMDTDVEVVKPLDKFLDCEAFSSFEGETNIPTALLGAAKGNKWIGDLLEYYRGRHFVKSNGKYDTTTNVEIITRLSVKHGFVADGCYQELRDNVCIYPKEYFCPFDLSVRKMRVTENTHAIHHYNGSWVPKWRKAISRVFSFIPIRDKRSKAKKLMEHIKRFIFLE